MPSHCLYQFLVLLLENVSASQIYLSSLTILHTVLCFVLFFLNRYRPLQIILNDYDDDGLFVAGIGVEGTRVRRSTKGHSYAVAMT